MTQFEKCREANALAQLSRRIRDSQKQDADEHLDTSTSDTSNTSSSLSPCNESSGVSQVHEDPLSSATTSSSSLSTSDGEPREEENVVQNMAFSQNGDGNGGVGLHHQEVYQEFIDDDTMVILETSVDKERNDMHACLYAIEYVLSRS